MFKEHCIPFNADGTAGGPVHLVIGHAGAGLCFNTLPKRPSFWDKVLVTHGYMRVEANGTDMHCEVSMVLSKCVYSWCNHFCCADNIAATCVQK